MNDKLELETSYLSSGPDALCWLEIKAGDNLLTANVRDGVERAGILISPLPLARWFGNSFWRLTSETGPGWEQTPDFSWQMAHQMQASGEGYVWPNLLLYSNDRQISLVAGKQDEWQSRMQGCQFVTEAICQLSIGQVREELLRFIGESSRITHEEELEYRHGQILKELAEEDFRHYRELEAMLGYDPDCAPESLIDLFADSELDYSSLAEIASGLNPLAGVKQEDQEEKFGNIVSNDNGLAVRFDLPRHALAKSEDPWTGGRKLAKWLRKQLGLDSDSWIAPQTLLDCLRLTKGQFEDLPAVQDASLCAMDDNRATIKILEGRSRQPQNLRFQAARIIGAWLTTPVDARWFTLTKSMSWEQQCQRNFAAEFLAPINAISNMLKETGITGADNIRRVAEHFLVSPMTICHSLASHGLIDKQEASRLMRDIESNDNEERYYGLSPSPC